MYNTYTGGAFIVFFSMYYLSPIMFYLNHFHVFHTYISLIHEPMNKLTTWTYVLRPCWSRTQCTSLLLLTDIYIMRVLFLINTFSFLFLRAGFGATYSNFHHTFPSVFLIRILWTWAWYLYSTTSGSNTSFRSCSSLSANLNSGVAFISISRAFQSVVLQTHRVQYLRSYTQ